MLFNFQTLVNDWRKDEATKELIEAYESSFGTIKGRLEDQLWYKEYVLKFNSPHFYQADRMIVKGVKLNLIYQLILASYSIQKDLQEINNLIDVGILDDLDRKNSKRTFFISELSDDQLFELFIISCQEQIQFQVLCSQSNATKKGVNKRRENNINLWHKQLKALPIRTFVTSIESEILAALR